MCNSIQIYSWARCQVSVSGPFDLELSKLSFIGSGTWYLSLMCYDYNYMEGPGSAMIK